MATNMANNWTVCGAIHAGDAVTLDFHSRKCHQAGGSPALMSHPALALCDMRDGDVAHLGRDGLALVSKGPNWPKDEEPKQAPSIYDGGVDGTRWRVYGTIDAGEEIMFDWSRRECMPTLLCGRAKVWAKSELRPGDTAVIKGNMAELHHRGKNWPAIKEGDTERHEVESVEIPLQTALRYRPPHGTVKEWAESLRLNMPAIVAEEPMYHKSASTAKCLGGPVPPKKEVKMPEQKPGPKPGPKLEWDVEISPYAISVRLLADATTVGMEERIRLFRFTDKLLIRSMKRCLLKRYNLARQESGPVTE